MKHLLFITIFITSIIAQEKTNLSHWYNNQTQKLIITDAEYLGEIVNNDTEEGLLIMTTRIMDYSESEFLASGLIVKLTNVESVGDEYIYMPITLSYIDSDEISDLVNALTFMRDNENLIKEDKSISYRTKSGIYFNYKKKSDGFNLTIYDKNHSSSFAKKSLQELIGLLQSN